VAFCASIKVAIFRANLSNGGCSDSFGSEMNAMTKTGFRRVALAASIGPTAAGLVSISESFAQNPLPPPAPGTAEVERVIVTAEAEGAIVTGSKIPTAGKIGSNPVFSLNRDLINKSGQGTPPSPWV
jgi:hypothetical protein